MAYIIETPNPFQPLTDIVKHEHLGGITIRQWLALRFPGFEEFDQPTICVCNGQPLLRDEWNRKIGKDDVINFVAVPEGITFLILAIVLAVASIAVTLFLGAPTPTTGEQPASDPVFSTKGQSNAIRLLEPIECPYGRNRIYPSFASRPYFQYINNDQFQYALFCIGQGYYDIEATQIGDSDINDYQEVEFAYYEPGEEVTLFPTNVYTSIEAGGQELYAPNEADYIDDGWVGPFVAVASGDTTGTIQVDVVFPKGLYESNSDGGLNSQTVEFEIEAREIDDAGVPIGAYFAVADDPNSVTGSTTTPQRRTISAAMPADLRYEVRMRRTNERTDSHRNGNQIQWEGLKSYVTDADQNFGNVTLLAVKIRATNNLNSRTQQRFNVVCVRKLQQHQSDGFTVPYLATRSIVWALVDVFRAQYGGRVTDEVFYDWDTLYALEAEYEARGEYFDWIFRDPSTVWEAARIIVRAGRGTPLITGSLITAVRDGELTTPVAMFTQDNIIEGSFSRDIKLWDLDEYDSIRMEYTEPSTGYKQESVIATLPFGTTDTPQDVRLAGIQDRDHAYHEALYLLAVDRYQRENITFETGLEGYIPTFGDLIIVAHDVPRWSQSGYVVNVETESSGDIHLWLSEPLEWESGQPLHIIYLRSNLGDVLGPFTANETTDLSQVRINSLMLTEADFLTGGENEPMLFMFGVSGTVDKFARVVKIDPQGGESIRVTCVNEDARVHSFDSLSAPALADIDHVPVLPELPVVVSVTVTQLNTTVRTVQASWGAAFGAEYYIVQESTDGVHYSNVAETTRTSIQWQVRPGVLYTRVAAVNFGQGPWASSVVSIGSLAGLDNPVPWVDLEWTIEWLELLNALSYDVKVYCNIVSSDPVLVRTTNILMDAERTYTYDINDAVPDGNECRDHLVTVTPIFSDSEGEPAELALTNPIPSPPTSLASALVAETSDILDLEYSLSWVIPIEHDLIRLAVWIEEVDGFDPAVETPVLDEIQSGVGYETLPTGFTFSQILDSFGEHGPIRWRVAVFDIWGNEISTNVSEQQTIHATSGWVA